MHPDVYVGSAVDVDAYVRVRALRVWSRGDGIVAGPLAAAAWDAECPWEDSELIVPEHARAPAPDVRPRVGELPLDEVALLFDAWVTTPVRTAFDLARRPPLVDAVAAVDALAFVCRLSVDDLRVLVDRHTGARGIVQVRRVLELMDPLAESCMETRTRLALVLRGVPAPVSQFEVVLPSGKRARLDLAWPHAKVAVEYDGPEHRTITGQNRDAFRNEGLDELGWDVVHVTSAMVLDPRAADRLAARIGRKVGRG
ncbi:MAG TPA: hypothetical protein VGH76_08890 [Actinomycetospora sp.]|uniref:hypothetical protein n=1 Tax=Actinomycetospora sp. TaxID=1872135 RepID=UPI002F425A16